MQRKQLVNLGQSFSILWEYLEDKLTIHTLSDEDITSMDMHEASPLDIQPIQGPITRARARQLNLEVSSFLSVPINNFKNDLLPIVYNVIRNQGEDQEIHGGRLGGVEGQQGEAKSHGGPL
jgi:hypothetical protein